MVILQVILTDLFRVLRDQLGEDFDSFISSKIVVIPGDVSLNNFGLKDEKLMSKMLEEINVVVNFAASTKFDERYIILLWIIDNFCFSNKFYNWIHCYFSTQIWHLNGCKYNGCLTCLKLRKELSSDKGFCAYINW